MQHHKVSQYGLWPQVTPLHVADCTPVPATIGSQCRSVRKFVSRRSVALLTSNAGSVPLRSIRLVAEDIRFST